LTVARRQLDLVQNVADTCIASNAAWLASPLFAALSVAPSVNFSYNIK
jgi:hypothetical protein